MDAFHTFINSVRGQTEEQENLPTVFENFAEKFCPGTGLRRGVGAWI